LFFSICFTGGDIAAYKVKRMLFIPARSFRPYFERRWLGKRQYSGQGYRRIAVYGK
jgi:hypothetical protein